MEVKSQRTNNTGLLRVEVAKESEENAIQREGGVK